MHDPAVIERAVQQMADETVETLVKLARHWACQIEASGLPYDGPQALRIWANTTEQEWAKTAEARHAAEH